MSTFEIPCLFCPDMISSGEEMKVLREGDDGAILTAAHPDCYEREMERISAESLACAENFLDDLRKSDEPTS